MTEHYSNVSNVCVPNIKRLVWTKLNENPLLTPMQLAKLLDLDYKKYRNYLTQLRSNWKHYSKNERGSKCSNFHAYRAGVSLGCELNAELRGKLCFSGGAGCFVGFGWQLSRARNRFLVWRGRGRLGRVVWFETGVVRLFVKAPGNLGKAKQLFCDAFIGSGLLTDVAVFSGVLDRIGVKGGHFVYGTPQRLPSVTITDFYDSHGIVIKTGDRSHPNAVEVIAEFSQRHSLVEERVKFIFDLFQEVGTRVGVDGLRRTNSSVDGVGGVRPLDHGSDYSC